MTRPRVGHGIRNGNDAERARPRSRAHRARTIAQALLSALLLVLAAPPFDVWPLALVALVPLLSVVRDADPGEAAALGWLCGFATNLGGLRWGYALLDRFGHLPAGERIALLLLFSAYQGCVFALWTGARSLLARHARMRWLVSAPLAVAVAESALPFLFPWNLAITMWRAWPLLQVAELGGPAAVSALLVLINATLLEAGQGLRERHAITRPVKVAAGVVLGLVGLGLLRAAHVAQARGSAPRIRVGVVQPNAGTITMSAATSSTTARCWPRRTVGSRVMGPEASAHDPCPRPLSSPPRLVAPRCARHGGLVRHAGSVRHLRRRCRG